MKKLYLLAISIVALQAIAPAQTSHIITTSGFTFVPATVSANVGDTIIFNVDFSMHPIQQVSSTTWAADQSTALTGGFSNSAGSTYSVVMTQPGTVYYVCKMHVALYGMKGQIQVAGSNGVDNLVSGPSLAFPNPADQLLSFTPPSSGNFSYTITNMSGQVVKKDTKYATPQSIITIDVSAIVEGNYVFSLSGATGVVNKSKITIKH